MAEYESEVGLSQRLNGADGYLLYAECIGAPATYCTEASTYAVGCVLFQRDSSTGYKAIVWKNTGTVAVPAWTQQGGDLGLVLAAGSTRTLTAPQSGATVLLDTATGSVVTLPAPIKGLKFTFIVSVTVTSNSHKVITDAGTTLLVGMIALMEAAATSAVGCLFDGTGNVAITMNGSTTGGIKGTRFTVECISATVWEISGLVAGSGSLSTPAANS
jgi:hypothetical protein